MIEPSPVVSDSVAEKKKAASKREKNDAGISSSEREQARRDNGKPAKKTAGDATATEKWPFEWLPFGMQE